MSTTYNAKILLKRGTTDPSTFLDLAEPGFDTSANVFYIGKGVGVNPIIIGAADVNKAYVDGSLANKIDKAGDTMTGDLIIASDTITPLLIDVSIDDYTQLNVVNNSPGTHASSDIVATANNGSETDNYVDMGINSSGYNQNIVGIANDAYLYSKARNLLIGNSDASADLIFFSGGYDAYGNTRLKITNDGKILIGQPVSTNKILEINGDVNITGTYYVNDAALITPDVDKAYVDASLGVVWQQIGYIDSSFGVVWTKINNIDLSINSLWTQIGYVDSSLNSIWNKIADIDTSLNNINVDLSPYAVITNVETSLGVIDNINLNQDISIASAALKIDVDTSLLAYQLSIDTSTWFTFNTLQNPIEDYGGELRAGIKILTADVPLELSFDNDGYAKIGKPGTYFETVAVRDSAFDSALDGYFAKWNQGTQRFDGYDLMTYLDGSLAERDTSILNIWTKLGSVDTSLDSFKSATDASIANIKARYIPDSSLNQSTFKWIGGYLEPSAGGGLDRPAIDASYAIKSGFAKITVSATQPSNPTTGDLWIDIN